MTEYPIVIVHWVDIMEHTDKTGFKEEDAKTLGLADNEHTVGYLIFKDNKIIRLANDYSPKDKSFRRVDVIPRFNVKSIVVLKKTSGKK